MVGGPGLVSTSPARIRRERSQEVGDLFISKLRIKLFLMLNGEDENGLGGVRARLTWGREKRDCWLLSGWMRVRGGGVPGGGGRLGLGGEMCQNVKECVEAGQETSSKIEVRHC